MVRKIWAALALLGVVIGAPAFAQSAGAPIQLELNRLEQTGETCRFYLVVQNGGGEAIEAFKVDLVFFDTDEVVRSRLYVELGPLTAAKRAVRLFDLPSAQCSELSSVLLNNVVACAAPGGEKLDCAGRLQLSRNEKGAGGVTFN